MAERLVLAFLLAAAAVQAASAVDTKLTLHNLCPFTVYPLITANDGLPSISDNTVSLDGNGRGLVSFPFPPTFWSGRVVARTGCTSAANCETGTAPPETVVQLVVHSTETGSGKDLATYSVSLAEGFNVGAVLSPQDVGGGQCPALGCPVDLNNGCPVEQRVLGSGGAVVARTGCTSAANCETGTAPPETVVQLVVHSTEAGSGKDLATYSVSLAEGFNVGAVVSPQDIDGGQCPALGCPVDLNNGCPVEQRVLGNAGAVVACKGDPGYFKQRCPLTRVSGRDVEAVPQNCLAPGELKVVFCQTTM